MILLVWIESLPGLASDRIERFIGLARAALAWERLWPALFPIAAIAGLYASAALFGAFDYIPAEAHALLLAASAVAAGFFLQRNFRDFALPHWHDGARRLERDSLLVHRPITERNDTMAVGAGDATAEEFWRAHTKSLLARIGALKLTWPSPGLGKRDRYGLRFAVLLLLIAGFFVAGSDWSVRLGYALFPETGAGGASATVDAWINPPAYTGEAPVYLQRNADGKPVAVPIGSELVVRVHGARNPRLVLDPAPDTRPAFKGEGDERGSNVKLTASGEISVRTGGRTLGEWNIQIIPDDPPSIAFATPPSKTERDAVKIAIAAADDYGIVAVRALITPVKAAKSARTLTLDLPVSSAKTLKQTFYNDLTENPYAGLEVQIVLEARDGANQKTQSKPMRFKLPARVFVHPLARALIEQRQNLALGAPQLRDKVVRTLDALTYRPDLFFQDQASVFMAMRSAIWALRSARSGADIKRVEDLLWQTALAIENGGVTLAAEQMRKLQQLLTQALMQNAPQEVIDALLQRYREALQRYLQALAQNAKPGSNMQVPPDAKELSMKDLQTLLDAIEQMAQSGSREQAAQALAMLQSLLENLHMQAGNGNGTGNDPGDKAMGDAIQGLGELMGRQRDLMDKTFRQQQGNPDPKDGGGKGLAQQQQQLRDDLGKVLKGLDGHAKTPKSFGQAHRNMGDAQNKLGTDQFDGAGESEKDALDALRQGSSELAQEMMKRSGQQPGNGTEQDPFGRTRGARGSDFGNDVKVPEQSDLERARNILKELRRRAAERGRPKEELDYIDRLLKQF